MPAPHNPFKHALAKGQLQIGCWLGLADAYVSEISADAGFDWLVVDFRRHRLLNDLLKGLERYSRENPESGMLIVVIDVARAGSGAVPTC